MIKRDYMKEVENSLKLVIEKVDQGIINNTPEIAFKAINKELKGLVGLDIDTINTLSFSSVIDLINRENEYNGEKYIALAELLRLNGYLLLRLQAENECLYYYNKALAAFCQALEEEHGLAENFILSIEAVIEQLNQYQLSIEESLIVFRVDELLGKYDKAEDILFNIIKESEKDQRIIEKGIEFYNRLVELPEEELVCGNLPIDEVKASLSELKKY